jgi:hypothetical protein
VFSFSCRKVFYDAPPDQVSPPPVRAPTIEAQVQGFGGWDSAKDNRVACLQTEALANRLRDRYAAATVYLGKPWASFR